MIKRIVVGLCGIVLGFGIGITVFFINPTLLRQTSRNVPLLSGLEEKEVIGFLPYWLLSTAKQDYSPYITTLTYFGLQMSEDGSIQKLSNEQEAEPGWEVLRSGKLNPYFQSAQKHGVSLSLLLTGGSDDTIASLIDQPVTHGKKLIADVTPILNTYNFSDLNLDIEYTQIASVSARNNFTLFVKTVRNTLPEKFSLTVEVTGDDLIKGKLIDPAAMGKVADTVVVMTYDYHYPGSFVSGAVAPLSGASTIAEYDVTTAIQLALRIIPAEKIIMGVPLYGYQWETLGSGERLATIPGTGAAASNRRAEKLLASCASCSAQFNQQDQEMFVQYKDDQTNTYNQFFYPDQRSTAAKIDLANSAGLGGIALWALGYEGNTILEPLKNYK